MRVAICHRCPKKRRESVRLVVCGETGRNITDHAGEGFCPLGRFPAMLPDDDEAVRAIKDAEVRRLVAGGCCGKPSGG